MPAVKRSPRNSVTDRPAGWRLALRRLRRLLRPFTWAGLAAIVLVVGVAMIRSVASHGSDTLATIRERVGSLTAASGLRVSEVVFEGQANTPEPLLWAALGIKTGDPILGFSLDDTRARLETIPWIEQATVERRLPGTIVINLKERRPFAIWQNQGKFVLVDRTGQVVTNQDVAKFPHLPLIVGQGAPAAAATLLDAMRERPELADKVTAAVRVGERRWNLRLHNGTDVMLPEGHEVAALDRLMQLQQDQAVLDRPLAAIDLRLPDRLVFRPRPLTRDSGGKDGGKDGGGGVPAPLGTAPATVPVLAKKPT